MIGAQTNGTVLSKGMNQNARNHSEQRARQITRPSHRFHERPLPQNQKKQAYKRNDHRHRLNEIQHQKEITEGVVRSILRKLK